MKRFGFTLVAAHALLWASSLSAQYPTPAPMPLDAGAAPISGGPASYSYGGEMPYGAPSGGYCGDGSCGDGCGGFGGDGYGYCGPGGPGGPDGGFGHGRSLLAGRCGRGYFQLDAVMFHRGDNAGVPLVTTAGGTPVLSGNDPYFGFETLPRLTAGYVLPNDVAIESTYFYKDDFDAWAGAGAPEPPGSLRINDPAGVLGGLNISEANLNSWTSIQSLEVNFVETSRKINFLAGFRWLEIQDRMRLYAFGPAGNTFIQSIDTYNSMFGGHSGIRTSITRGLFTLETQGKAGLFFNSGTGQTATVASVIAPGFVLGQRAPGQTDGQCESFVGEIDGTLTFRPTAAVAFRLGYQVMWICNTSLAIDQIDPNNPILNTGTYLNDRGDIVLHGPSAGIDVRW